MKPILTSINDFKDEHRNVFYQAHLTDLFEIGSMSGEMLSEDYIHPSQRVEIFWFTRGTCHVTIDLETRQIYAGMVLCLRPGEVYKIWARKDIDGFIIRFQADFLRSGPYLPCEIMLSFSHSRMIQVDSNSELIMSEIIRSMQRELQLNAWKQSDVLGGFLRIFYIYLSRHKSYLIGAHQKQSSSTLVARFFDILERDFKTKKKASDYARALAVSPNYLNEVIKRESGYSVSAQVRKRLGLEARRKAITEDSKLKEIAYDLGFDDITHFSKFFKQECGQTFTRFRKMMAH